MSYIINGVAFVVVYMEEKIDGTKILCGTNANQYW